MLLKTSIIKKHNTYDSLAKIVHFDISLFEIRLTSGVFSYLI